MESRPVYRWKSFWLGVLVLCFLGWAWARSMTWCDQVTWQYAEATNIEDGRSVSVYQGLGRVSVSWDRPAFTPAGVRYRRDSLEKLGLIGSGKGFDTSGDFPEEVEEEWSSFSEPVGREGDAMWVAHWFLCAVFLLVWGSWLVWRWRREKRVC